MKILLCFAFLLLFACSALELVNLANKDESGQKRKEQAGKHYMRAQHIIWVIIYTGPRNHAQ